MYFEDRVKTVRYWGDNGDLDHITQDTKGNQEYADRQRVAVEVDMTTVPRRATFFVDDIEQPNYVIGIPSEIRFWVRSIQLRISTLSRNLSKLKSLFVMEDQKYYQNQRV
ncbi:MAG: hypothetical protein EZS28_039015 [Streblomastix strix]|uniref:Uncharacterized protein n=1 Tax=Streblomastix strix TaxID=222440 RepID=A0A5J4U589_9EUKA|nr:MAG: hypothetical protein EZS28_039015 [Streblomastix strix]